MKNTESKAAKTENGKSGTTLRILLALILPAIFFFWPGLFNWEGGLSQKAFGLFAETRFWFFIFLAVVATFGICLHRKGKTAGWFRLCDCEDEKFKDDLDKRWEKVCYGAIYGLLGTFVVATSLYKTSWLSFAWFPADFIQETGLAYRLMWCFGWSLVGFATAAFSDARRSRNNVRSPFPSYVYFYPAFLVVNSLLVFGLLNLVKSASGKEFFYPVSAFFCLNLGFWIDTINFQRLVDKLMDIFSKSGQ